MRIFVAGATGAVGQHLVSPFTAAGHQVTGTTRSEAKAAALRAQGNNARTGSTIKTEEDPLDPRPLARTEQSMAAIEHIERVVPDNGGIVLRYGGFYGQLGRYPSFREGFRAWVKSR
jgi:nucleoside-diphosphate-sugar epimerase